MKTITKIITGILSLGAVSGSLLAAEIDDQALEEELKYLKSEAIFITTASKTAENIDRSIATVTMIEQKQIRQMGARNLVEVLRIVPGLGITQSELGNYEIEARGIKTSFSEKVLIMLNGHALDHNLTNAGSTSVYDDMPVDNVERVEVVRGTGSALYGANAFLAIINIITRETKAINGAELTVRGGSFNTQNYNINYGKDFSGLKVGGNFNFSDTSGIHAFIKQDAVGASGNSNNHRMNYDLSWDIEYDELKLEGRFINKKMGSFIGVSSTLGSSGSQDWNDYFLRLTHTHKFTDDLSITSKVAYSNLSFDNLWQFSPNFFYRSGIENRRLTGESQISYKINKDNTLIAGLSVEQQKQSDMIAETGNSPASLTTSSPWTKPTQRFLWSAYAQDMWDVFESLRLVAGVRYDHYSDFGSTFNPRVGLNWEFIKNYTLRFSYGSAFRAPSFGETTLANNTSTLGSSNLSSESVKTFELGLTAHVTDALQGQITLYQSQIKDIISLQSASTTVSQYKNQGEANTRGIEFEGKYTIAKNTYLAFNYAYQHAQDDRYHRLADTPQHRANIMANVELTPQVNLYIDTLLKSATTRVLGDNRDDVAGYGVANSVLTVKDIGFKGWEASFSVSNLLDKKYYSPASSGIPYDLPQAERAFFGTVRFKF
jgi:iron complex outermembrane receptor protein